MKVMSMHKTLHPNKQDPQIRTKKEGVRELRIRDFVFEKFQNVKVSTQKYVHRILF